MLGTRLVRLIEKHSDEIANGLVAALCTSEQTSGYRKLSANELRASIAALYSHLEEWLISKQTREVDLHFAAVGARRAAEGIPSSQLAWALMMSKAELWAFVYREGAADKAHELYVELEFLVLLDRFFDRAIYSALIGHENSARATRAA
jgi:hypothetical protein